MFKVRNIITGEIRTVYGVSGIMFLFHNGSVWFSDYMERYEPVEETE